MRRLLDRVQALEVNVGLTTPVGDRAFAVACIDRWQQLLRGLVDPDGTVLRVLQAVDEDAAAIVEHLDRRDPLPPLATAWTLEWAECPIDLLVDPALPDDEESLPCYGYYHGGLTSSAAPGIDRLVMAMRSVRSYAEVDWRHCAGPPTPYATACGRFAADMLRQLAGRVVRDALLFAALHPTFRDNPYEPELALVERGLFPLGAHEGVCYVVRPATVPVVVPGWLPFFTGAR